MNSMLGLRGEGERNNSDKTCLTDDTASLLWYYSCITQEMGVVAMKVTFNGQA